MSTRTSSLRRTERRRGVCASACAATLALMLAGPAWAASAPSPDDPPSGPRSEASPRIATAPTVSPPATGGSAAGAPSPDAPVVKATRATPAPGTASTSTPSVRAPSPTQTAATESAPVTARPAASPTGGSGVVTSKPKPKPKPKAAAHASRAGRHPPTATAEPTRVGPPHDGNRLGLPGGTAAALAAVTGDSGRTALLAAAALLLVAAAAGGFVVGIVGRRLARPV
jgi:hypothetical protein